MPTMELTKRNIDALKSAANRYAVWDYEISNFGLRVEPSGKKIYVLKYRMNGRQGWVTIGRHGSPWTPKQARLEAQKLLGEIARGIDPANKRTADRAAISFAELCDLYLAEGVSHKKASTLRSDRGRIAIHLKPLLGSRRADAITRADLERVLNDIIVGKTAAQLKAEKPSSGNVAKGGKGAAGQCIALASTIFQFAVDRGLRSDNPARGVKKPPVRKMQRFLDEAELARLAEALDGEAANLHVVAAIKLLALTGCRLGEIMGLQWQDVDLGRQLLNLRDSKTGEKVVYLSAPAAQILSDLPRISGNPFVIAGTRAGRPFIGIDKVWRRICARANLENARLHDLRHTFASFGVGGGLNLPIIGRLLGHTQVSTTQRYAHLAADPVRHAANSIGSAIAAAMEGKPPADVVPLRRGGK